MNFKDKRVLIAPYSPTSKALADVLLEYEPSLCVLGYVDQFKVGDGLYAPEQLDKLDYDFILILSPNHFPDIYKNLKKLVAVEWLIKVDINNYQYQFLAADAIKRQLRALWYQKFKRKVLRGLARWYDKLGRDPERMVFLAKSFVGGNTKAFYFYSVAQKKKAILLTDNLAALTELKQAGFNAQKLGSWSGMLSLASAYWLVQDQANHTEYFACFGRQQKTLQMWHGIPLKTLSPQKNMCYDMLLSTSEFVSQTSLAALFEHRKIIHSGYPRNDLLKGGVIEHEHLLTDRSLTQQAKQMGQQGGRVLVYMPTHREYDVGIGEAGMKPIPLDWTGLDQALKGMNTMMLIKLHPFVEAHYQQMIADLGLEHIKVYPAQKDIYPLLKYSHALITDYSSVYFDYLLLDKPIVFFCYDFDQYADNKNGWTYPFDDYTPGEKVYACCFQQLVDAINNSLQQDSYAEPRRKLAKKLFQQNENYSEALLRQMDG